MCAYIIVQTNTAHIISLDYCSGEKIGVGKIFSYLMLVDKCQLVSTCHLVSACQLVGSCQLPSALSYPPYTSTALTQPAMSHLRQGKGPNPPSSHRVTRYCLG